MNEYKRDLDTEKKYLKPDLVFQFIDFLSVDDFQQKMSSDNENPNATTFLLGKLDEQVQSFNNYICKCPEELSSENCLCIVEILKKLKESLVLFQKFYLNPKYNLPNFPYQEIYDLILTSFNLPIITLSFECINAVSKIDLTFDVESVPKGIIEKLLVFVSDFAEDESLEILEFVSILIQKSPELCDLFISNGLFHIFDNWIEAPFCIFALESVIMTCEVKNVPTLLIYCDELLESENKKVVEKSFHCLSLFILRFGFKSIDEKTISKLYKIIVNFINNSKSALNLCLLIPDDSPPPSDILPIILDVIQEPVFDTKIQALSLSLLIHFYNAWQDSLTKEYISDTLFFGAQNKEFETSIKFAECAIFYHKFDDFQFDLSVFQICLDYLETDIHSICILKIYEILTTDASKFPDEFDQMKDLMTSDVIESINKFENESESSEERSTASLILKFLDQSEE